jgi:hypothetical protein
VDAGSRSVSINRIAPALPLTKRELDAVDSSFSILFRFLDCQRYGWRGCNTKVPVLRTGWVVVDSIQTQSRHQSVSLCREYFDGGVTMSRRRKPFHHPTPEYNAYLAGWVFAFSVVLVTLMLIAHGVHF